MPYVYDDPAMFGQNPFARPVNQRPVPTQSAMTRPMPARPGSGQAVNTQGGQSVNGVPIGPGGRPSVDMLPGVGVLPYKPEDLTSPGLPDQVTEVAAPSQSQILQEQLQAIADRDREQTVTVPIDGTPPVSGGSVSPLFGTGGFEFIGLIAIGALIYYMARA